MINSWISIQGGALIASSEGYEIVRDRIEQARESMAGTSDDWNPLGSPLVQLDAVDGNDRPMRMSVNAAMVQYVCEAIVDDD